MQVVGLISASANHGYRLETGLGGVAVALGSPGP